MYSTKVYHVQFKHIIGGPVRNGSEKQRVALHCILHATVTFMIVSDYVCVVMLRQEMTIHYTEKNISNNHHPIH